MNNYKKYTYIIWVIALIFIVFGFILRISNTSEQTSTAFYKSYGLFYRSIQYLILAPIVVYLVHFLKTNTSANCISLFVSGNRVIAETKNEGNKFIAVDSIEKIEKKYLLRTRGFSYVEVRIFLKNGKMYNAVITNSSEFLNTKVENKYLYELVTKCK